MDPEVAFRLALEHHRAKRFEAAEAAYRRILDDDPGHAACHYRLGVLALQGGKPRQSIKSFRAALDHGASGSDAHEGLAIAYRRLGDGRAALRHYREVAALLPESAEARLNLGAALSDQMLYAEAAASFTEALALSPELFDACRALALALNRLGRFADAAAVCRSGLERRPADPVLARALGAALKEQGRLAEAEALLNDVISRDPDDPEAGYTLGGVLKDQGRTDEAVACFRDLVARHPDHAPARIALCMAHLPPLYGEEAELDRRRTDYLDELRTLAAWADTAEPGSLADGVGASQPFYLAYQGRNDVEPQRLYGDLVCGAMAARYPSSPLAAPPKPGERIRVGFVSGFLRRHANWRMPISGWVKGLDRARFEIFGLHTGQDRDDETARAEHLFDCFVQGPLSTEDWRAAITAAAPHVLIYPEVGMDPLAARLAAQRLAPVQCNAWGHPTTSGFPTLDYFLSSDLMEPAEARSHYSERLVRLPGLSAPFEPPILPPASRQALGLRPDATVFWCGQSPYKYLPQVDSIFARIAERAGDCQFVFVAFPGSDELTARFQERLTTAFAERGLDASRACRILPRLSADDFLAAMGAADIALDSIGWSGCNSLVEALAWGLPVVTNAGPLMRGRHGAALLSRLGLADCVSCDLESYISRAVDLALGRGLRRDMSDRIVARLPVLFDEGAAISSLADFLTKAVSSVPPGDEKP